VARTHCYFLVFGPPIVEQNTTVIIHRGEEWNRSAGAPPSGWEGGSWGGISSLGVRDARWAETHLWPAPSSLYYLQLLWPAAAIENVRARDVFVRELVS
jgi:hypothetical protein